jgi:uncharacterized protein (DUF488 family)
MRLFTIGFTKTSAEGFFSRLSKAHVKKLIDVRLNNVSQLAGFAKKEDLRYFARAICGIDYKHLPELAPTQTFSMTIRNRRVLGRSTRKDSLTSCRNGRSRNLIVHNWTADAYFAVRTSLITAIGDLS